MRNEARTREPYFVPKLKCKTWRLVTDDYGNQEWWHSCVRCNRWLCPWNDFWRVKDRPGAYCKPCNADVKRNRYQNLTEDRHAEVLERRRFYYRKEQNAKGIEPNYKRGYARLKYKWKNGRDFVPVEPMQEWVKKKIISYGGILYLADVCGVDQRTITRIQNAEYKMIELAVVDSILTNEGSTTLSLLYPEEYSEAA